MAGIKGDNPSKDLSLKQELILRKHICPSQLPVGSPIALGQEQADHSDHCHSDPVTFPSGERREDKGGGRAGGGEQQPLPTLQGAVPLTKHLTC